MSMYPWQTPNTPGGPMARELKPKTLARLLKKNAVVFVGAKLGTDSPEGEWLRNMVKLFRQKKIPIFATPLGAKHLREMGIVPAREFAIHDFTKRISDKRWDILGIEVETVVFAGIVYYLQSQGLAAIKHNALDVKSISLDPYCSPNATYSSPSVPKRNLEDFYSETIAAIESM